MFENLIADYTGSKYAIACMNGTAGLQISLMLAGVTNKDLVLAPNLTFVATLNAISYTGARPILFDIDKDNWQIDVELLKNWLDNNTVTKLVNNKIQTFEKVSKRKIAAILPVYVLGKFVNIEKLLEISKQYGIAIVEDSTEALGSFKNEKHAGTFGLFGVISFNGNKIISTGGGGMILTNEKDLAIKAKHITTTAKTNPVEYFHDHIGYNYRLVNVLAAIGVAQMENFEKILRSKKEIYLKYQSSLIDVGDIKFQRDDFSKDSNYWLFTFRTKNVEVVKSP